MVLTRSRLFHVIISFVTACLLLWSISYGYQTATEPQKHLWIACVGVLVMLCGFYLLVKGMDIFVELFLRVLEEEDYEDC